MTALCTVCAVCVCSACVFSSPTIFLEEQWGGAQWWGCIAFVFSSFKSELVSGAEQLCDCVKFDSGCICVFVCFLCNEIPSKHFYENRNFQCESILSSLCCLSIKISIIILKDDYKKSNLLRAYECLDARYPQKTKCSQHQWEPDWKVNPWV